MKRALLVIASVLVAWFAGSALYVAMASDETRIRWLFEEEAAAFNGTAVFGVVDRFADDYRDVTSGLDRHALRAGILWAFQNRRSATGAFRYRVELPPEGWTVAVDGDRAAVTAPMRLYDRPEPDAAPSWDLVVEADLERRDGGWWIVRSQHETRSGERPR